MQRRGIFFKMLMPLTAQCNACDVMEMVREGKHIIRYRYILLQ